MKKFFPRNSKKRVPESSFQILRRTLGRLGYNEQAILLTLKQSWPKAMGETIAQRTQPHRFYNHTLFIYACNHAWQMELMMLKLQIIERLNGCLQQPLIKHIRIQCSHQYNEQLAAQRLQQKKEQIAIPEKKVHNNKVKICAQSIRDEHIKEAFMDLYTMHLTKNKNIKD